jgi:hypothetical protein
MLLSLAVAELAVALRVAVALRAAVALPGEALAIVVAPSLDVALAIVVAPSLDVASTDVASMVALWRVV